MAGVAIVLLYFLQEAFTGGQQYVATLKQERQEKDRSFRTSSTSPLAGQEAQASFTSLQYYEPDISYKLEARYQPIANPDTVFLNMTKGESEAYLRFARASFELEGQPQELVLFRRIGEKENELFVPFTDKTNGFETYGGGRYLDVPLPESGSSSITLDFNRAYNPFCAYNDEYACPVPPADNRLRVSVPAGEKAFHE